MFSSLSVSLFTSPSYILIFVYGLQILVSLNFSDSVGILVFSDCHNKVLQTTWLKQQEFIFSQFWRMAVQNKGAGRVGLVSGEGSLQVADSALWLCPHIVV